MDESKVIKVLDHGFVRLVDSMGDDSSVVEGARVSYGKGTKTVNEDRGLIRYLMRMWHTSPSELVDFKFHIKCPIFVMRQLVRHRTASLSEYSGRYSIMTDDCYVPELDRITTQSKNNKQGSSDDVLPNAQEIQDRMKEQIKDDIENYHEYLDDDLAREIARINLPVSNYTEFYWKINMHNLFHFLRLRLDSHAQYEIRVFAEAIYELIKPIVPMSCEAFEDYRLHSESMSRMEMELLKTFAKSNESRESFVKWLEISKSELYDKLSKREKEEFLDKLFN